MKLPEPFHAIAQPCRAAGETPAQESFALRAEGDSRRQAQPLDGHEAFAKLEAVVHSLHAEKRVHRARREGRFDARQPVQFADQEALRVGKALPGPGDNGLSLGDRGDAGLLDEARSAGRVVFDQLAHVIHQRFGRDDPAQAPAGHQPGLRKRVGADDSLLGIGQIQE
jgi:hypothetical protein